MKKLIFSFSIALSIFKVSAQSILLTPGNQTTTNSSPDIILRSTEVPYIRSIRSAGTLTSPTPPSSGASLLRIRGGGFWGTYFSSDQVGIDMVTTENWGASAQGGDMRFSTTANGSIDYIERMRIDHNGNVGIGTTSPDAKLEVTGAANTEVRISTNLAGFGSSRLGFYSNKGTGNEWRPGYVATGDDGSFTGRLDFFTNGTGIANKTGSVLGMSVVNGRVGVGSSSPDFPLHVTSTENTLNSTTGAFAIGTTTGLHLTFDKNQMDSWSNTAGNTLFLNFHSNAKVQIGNGSSGNLDVNGFSNLGDGAPAIKMKKLTGTTAASATTAIAHGLTDSKILSVDVHVLGSTGEYYGPNSAYPSGFNFAWRIIGANIVLNFVGSSLQGRAYKVLLTYEE